MKKKLTILLISTALLLFWGAYLTHSSFIYERTQHRSDYGAPLEDAPPLMTFITVALGGFRGIIADILWLRSMELQEQGRFFELAQLADWITKLEPHFVTVWAFHAWNMAYNISNYFPDPEDRWRWVQHGIHLLRDEGIKLNPRQATLYWELAFLYQHKIGYIMDSTHWYYKTRLAIDIDPLLEGRGPDYKAHDTDPSIIRLQEDYKLDTEIMEAIDIRYGPLEWRHPAAHALYWAYRGREIAPDSRIGRNCARMIVQCMSDLFRQGTVFMDYAPDLFVATPDLEFLPNVIRSYEEILEHYNSASIRISYINFLTEAAMILFYYGRTEDASKLFDNFTDVYPHLPTNMEFEHFTEAIMNLSSSDMARESVLAMVEGLIFQSFVQIELGNESRSYELEQRAEQVWDDYTDNLTSEDHRSRAGLLPLSIIRDLAQERFNRSSKNAVVQHIQ